MLTDLEKLLELARHKPVSAEEREAQRRSFAFGNARLSDSRITRDSIEKAALDLAGQHPGTES